MTFRIRVSSFDIYLPLLDHLYVDVMLPVLMPGISLRHRPSPSGLWIASQSYTTPFFGFIPLHSGLLGCPSVTYSADRWSTRLGIRPYQSPDPTSHSSHDSHDVPLNPPQPPRQHPFTRCIHILCTEFQVLATVYFGRHISVLREMPVLVLSMPVINTASPTRFLITIYPSVRLKPSHLA